MSAPVVRPQVATFVAQVRHELSDLTPEEVDELVGGLEADLDERLADSAPGDVPAELGDPVAYAAELRSAAGLPPRRAITLRRAVPAVQLARLRWGRVRDAVTRQPWWPTVRDSVVALRPAWWVLRAWVASQLISGGWDPFNPGAEDLLVLMALVVVSVALGRGLFDGPLGLDRRWARRVLVGLNVFAVLALPYAFTWSQFAVSSHFESSWSTEGSPSRGLSLDGDPVRNVFAYDAQGNPIPLVQLYDERGRPLKVDRQSWYDEAGTQIFSDADGENQIAPWVDDRGKARWNVFPLPSAEVPEPSYDPDGNALATGDPTVQTVPPPLVAVPAVTGVYGVPFSAGLIGAAPTPTASPTISPTISPTASPTASPTGTP